MTVFYNEHDPFAAAWLRELIADNLIAPGIVDERSIEDIAPDELRSFRQCHFFAGVGVWSLAARLAGIPDDAPLWSGSCPCGPFSVAGKGEAFDDERHLWPSFHYLIEQCEPQIAVGEQVAGADGDAWFDLVSADLDATGYGFGVAETCAAGFGAPHKRNRNYWLAVALVDGQCARLEGLGGHGNDRDQPGWIRAFTAGSAATHGASHGVADGAGSRRCEGSGRHAGANGGDTAQSGRLRAASSMADDFNDGQRQHGGRVDRAAEEAEGNSEQRERLRHDPAHGGADGRLASAVGIGRGWWQGAAPRGEHDRAAGGRHEGQHGLVGHNQARPVRYDRPGPVNGYWADADWLRCRDEVWRPVRSGSFPLVDAGTVRNRVGLLRGAGNAVTIAQAEGFLRAVIDTVGRWW